MSLSRKLDRAVGVPTAYRLIDAAFFLALVGALAICYATGMPLAGVAAVAVAGFGAEYAVSGVVTEGLFRGVDWADESPSALRRAVADVAADLGIDPPAVVVDPDGPGGVNVFGDGDHAVLVASAATVDALDGDALRAIVAHELAHVALGHLRAVPVRVAATHVVGLAAFWLVALRHAPPLVAVLAGALFLVAVVGRSNGVNALFSVAASAGVVFVLRALAARASRLEECHADDVAVAHAGARAFCAGLYAVGATDRGDGSRADRSPLAARRSRLGRITSHYPSVEYRLSRQGFAPADVAGPAERGASE